MGTNSKQGVIFDIQRYCVHDGPGIRTTVFLKGCPLRCHWCCNPESQKRGREVIHRNSRCTHCGRCIEVCKPGSISLDDDGVHIDRSLCTVCGDCITVCSPQALAFVGEDVSLEKVLEELEKDTLFYRNSGGGITVSGGEPLLQADFAESILRASHERGWHTAVETSGYASIKRVEQVLKETDLVLYDLKHLDPDRHRELIGVPNDLILKNLRAVDTWGVPLAIRIPVIPTINDSEEHLRALAELVAGLSGVERVHLLPYHRLGASKYANLDRPYPLDGMEALRDEELDATRELFESYGLDVEIGG